MKTTNTDIIRQEELETQFAYADKLVPIFFGRRAAVKTYGCQLNASDSEKIAGLLVRCGLEMTRDENKADVVVINTCAIREHAELRVLSGTGQLKKSKELNPSKIIVMCGCMTQEPHRREQIKKSYPYVDLLFGTDMIHRLPEMLYNTVITGKRQFYFSELPHREFGSICEGVPAHRESPFRAWVPIMYGCNNFCTYCVVPSVRGHERSREKPEILSEVRSLVSGGYRDITLLGQNVNSYSDKDGFPGLIDDISALDGDFWLRFMTSHPKDASEELMKSLVRSEKAAKHFHLPFQAGSNRILKLMNRGYTREQYLEKALKIREYIPDCAVSTDIIIGFPGETEREFLETVDIVSRVEFDTSFVFIFSPRENTPAASMEDNIPHTEKTARFAELTRIQTDIAQKRNNSFVGSAHRVLSDGYDPEKASYHGRNSQNKIVYFPDNIEAGVFCDIKITSAQPYALHGTLNR